MHCRRLCRSPRCCEVASLAMRSTVAYSTLMSVTSTCMKAYAWSQLHIRRAHASHHQENLSGVLQELPQLEARSRALKAPAGARRHRRRGGAAPAGQGASGAAHVRAAMGDLAAGPAASARRQRPARQTACRLARGWPEGAPRQQQQRRPRGQRACPADGNTTWHDFCERAVRHHFIAVAVSNDPMAE